MSRGTFSVSEALRFGWETLKRNVAVSVGLVVASLVGMLLVDGLAQATQGYGTLALGFTLLTQLVHAFVAFVWVRFALAVHDARVVSVNELVPSGMTFLNYLAVSILYGLLVTAGLILLIVPGIYLAVRYGLAGFLVADRKTDVLGAFRASSDLTRGARMHLFLFGLTLLLLNLAGALVFGLGLLVTLPLSAFASALVYRRLGEHAAAHDQPLASPPWPTTA